jgi:hypothetical protein
MYVRLARAEERETLASYEDTYPGYSYAEAYRQYMARVPAFIPRLGRLFGEASVIH